MNKYVSLQNLRSVQPGTPHYLGSGPTQPVLILMLYKLSIKQYVSLQNLRSVQPGTPHYLGSGPTQPVLILMLYKLSIKQYVSLQNLRSVQPGTPHHLGSGPTQPVLILLLYELSILTFFIGPRHRQLVKSGYQKNNFLISQPKHMRRFFEHPKHMLKIVDKKIFTIFC